MENYYYESITKDITGKWVLDGVRDDIKMWHNNTKVFITTPTGSGKNTFILNGLIPFARSKNKKVLILSNRVALTLQQKNMLWEVCNDTKVSTDMLKNTYDFEGAWVFSYQEILHVLIQEILNLKNYKYSPILSNLGYIVFDEAHFFVSDSKFNAQTELILSTLINLRNTHAIETVNIYMTATPDQVKQAIIDHEIRAYSEYCSIPRSVPPKILKIYTYTATPNYSNYTFQFFTKWDSISNSIKNSRPSEKWLIFIKDKGDKTIIAKSLKKVDKDIKFDYIDADSKNSSVYYNVINTNKFEGRILVSTSTIDNGVNFHDPHLKYIVIDSFDPVSLIQMVGRKRIEENEEVTVFFRIPTKEEVSNSLNSCNTLLKNIEDYNTNRDFFITSMWGKMSKSLQNLFYLEPANYNGSHYYLPTLNNLSYIKLSFEKDILSEIKEILDKNNESGFVNLVLKWFNKNEESYSEDSSIASEHNITLTEFIQWLESQVDVEINKDSFDSVSQTFIDYCSKLTNDKCNKSSFKSYAQKQLAKLKLPYEFEKFDKTHTNPKWRFKIKTT